MVKLRGLLKKYMYHDRANVYRAEKVKNGKTDDYERQFKLIYEKMPCHLAQYGKELSAHRDDRTQNITEDLRLSYSPEYEILENDVLEVQHQGQTFKLIAGTAFKYATHVELSARRRKEAKQQ